VNKALHQAGPTVDAHSWVHPPREPAAELRGSATEVAGKVLRHVWSTVSLVAGTLVAGLGLASFLLPNQFIDGGVTGVSMLLARLLPVPLAVLLVVVNAPFVAVGYRHIGKVFAIKSSLAIVGLAVCLVVIPFPRATADKLLGAVFGGFFVGAGVGLAIRGGGVLDGTEVLAVLVSKRTFATVGEVVLGLNVAIFSVAAVLLGVEPALYSVLTYFAAFKTIDYLLHGIEAYNGVTVFSAHHEAIRQAILTEMGRGVTVLKAVGGYTAAEQEVLYCVVTRLELTRLESLVKARDESAFIVVSPVHEVSGGVIKQRVFH
jgi:uncharacterized membrane-anchored protein YitT (DUF2179 family)